MVLPRSRGPGVASPSCLSQGAVFLGAGGCEGQVTPALGLPGGAAGKAVGMQKRVAVKAGRQGCGSLLGRLRTPQHRQEALRAPIPGQQERDRGCPAATKPGKESEGLMGTARPRSVCYEPTHPSREQAQKQAKRDWG